MKPSVWKRSLRPLTMLSAVMFFITACARTPVYLPTPDSNSLASPMAQNDQRYASVAEVTGQVEVRPSAGDAWAAAKLGQRLVQDSQLRTGPAGKVLIRLTEGTKIWVGANTTFTFKVLNPFPENLLTALALDEGQVWILLSDGALDVEMPGDHRALARAAYLNVNYNATSGVIDVSCLQGGCYFNDVLIPSGSKLPNAETNTTPQPMGFADYGAWGVNVPEATQLAYLATEAVVQGDATMPVAPTLEPSPTVEPSLTLAATATPQPSATPTLPPDQPTFTPAPPTFTLPPSPTLQPSPTARTFPTATPVPFTPIPPAPVIGRHIVLAQETLYCIARVYGVLPGAIIQANGLTVPFTVYPGQSVAIPQVQWFDISPGPVCPAQFISPFPGLAVPTPTLETTPTPAGPPLGLTLDMFCIFNCGEGTGEYIVRVTLSASGGIEPYTFFPAQQFEITIPHCTDGTGTASVTSADGQTTTTSWFYRDVACAPTATP